MDDHNIDSMPRPAEILPRTAGLPPTEETPPQGTAARERLLEAKERLTAHRPSDRTVMLWHQQLAEDKARAMGQRVTSVRVMTDALAVIPVLVPVLLDNPLPGYGPRRAYYIVSLALELDERSRGLRIIETGKAGASRVKYDTLDAGQEKRRSFERLLGKATRGNSERQAQLDKAMSYDHDKPGELVASLELLGDIGQSLLDEAQTRPDLQEANDDMGLTQAEVTAVKDMARQLGAAAGDHGDQITVRQTGSDTLNELEGRLWFELELLTQAAAEARRRGRSVPTVRLAQLKRQRRRPPVTDPADDESPTEPDVVEPAQ
jgi:hypothetical protein